MNAVVFSPAAITILNSKHEGEMKYGRILIRRRFEKRGGDKDEREGGMGVVRRRQKKGKVGWTWKRKWKKTKV